MAGSTHRALGNGRLGLVGSGAGEVQIDAGVANTDTRVGMIHVVGGDHQAPFDLVVHVVELLKSCDRSKEIAALTRHLTARTTEHKQIGRGQGARINERIDLVGDADTHRARR